MYIRSGSISSSCLVGFNILGNSLKKNKVKETPISSTDKSNNDEVLNKIVDDNYLFVGDFSIDKLNKSCAICVY